MRPFHDDGDLRFEIYRPEGEAAGGNAAVVVPALTPQVRKRVITVGRRLRVNRVAVWVGNEVVALLNTD